MPSKNYGQNGIGATLEIGKGGPKLKNSSGVLEARNNADDAYAIMRGLSPVNDNDLVTLEYLRTLGDVRVTGQINGGAPPAVVNGAVYIVTTAGGGYGLKELWYGKGGSWEQITVPEGLTIVVTDALTGGTDEYESDHVYIWDEDNTEWDGVGPAPGVSKVEKNIRATIAFGDSGANNVGDPVDTDGITNRFLVNVTQAFDGSAPTLTIGDSGDPDRFMTVDECDLKTVGVYVVDVHHLYGSSTQVTATLTPDGSTQGQASVLGVWSKL